MQIKCYLVVGRKRGTLRVRRVTQRRSWLDTDEAMVRLVLDIPPELFDSPEIIVPVAPKALAVAAVESEEFEKDEFQ